jgi:hypothetical protein
MNDPPHPMTTTMHTTPDHYTAATTCTYYKVAVGPEKFSEVQPPGHNGFTCTCARAQAQGTHAHGHNGFT